MLFGGLTALYFLSVKAGLTAQHRVLINGASGAVGCMSVQLAKHLGAHVTAVCSFKNTEMVSSLGADVIIDYMKQDFTGSDERYDFIMDTVGNLSLKNCSHKLKANGKLILINPDFKTTLISVFKGNLICGTAAESKSAIKALVKLAESGAIKPVIDRIYSLDEIVQAHRYVETGHKVGSVVIRI